MSTMFVYASDKKASALSKSEIRVGLYQSEPFKLNAPNASNEPFRLFMKIFPEKKVALVISPATTDEISKKLIVGSDIAGDHTYSESDNTIRFNFGPTQHTATPGKPGFVKLRSVYANGNVNEVELSIVGHE